MRKWVAVVLMALSVNGFAAEAEKSQTSSAVITQDKPVVVISKGETSFTIKLKSNPTTGYSWFLREYTDSLLEPVKHEFIAPANKKLVGAPGYETWTFRVKPAAFVVPQETTIRFVYTRPWEQASDSTQVIFKVVSVGK